MNVSAGAARGWLESGKAPKERSHEVAFGLVLLSGQVEATPELLKSRELGGDVELALVEIAEQREDWGLVALLCAHARNKPCAKAARKALFRARQRGVELPELGTPRRAVGLGVRPDPMPSFCTSFDDAGNHVVALGGWSQGDAGWSLAGVVAADDRLRGIYYSPGTSRSRVRSLLDRVVPGSSITVEVPDHVAAGLLRHALDRARAEHTFVEGDVLRATKLLADVAPLQALEIALDAHSDARLARAVAEGAAHAHALAIRSWCDAVWSVAMSLTAADRRGEGRHAVVDAFMRGEARARWARRLEIAALLLSQDGASDAAFAACATARALRDGDAPASSLPLIQAALSA